MHLEAPINWANYSCIGWVGQNTNYYSVVFTPMYLWQEQNACQRYNPHPLRLVWQPLHLMAVEQIMLICLKLLQSLIVVFIDKD
ncbi:MAG: hypothetical protein [Circular genetic element sp.]|nr:MAG: hypothetical protein [Circular genetic element sp.]